MVTSKRAAGEGTVTKKPNGRWEARLMVDGVRISRSGATRKEALDNLKQATSSGAVVKDSKTRTIGDAVEAHTVHLRSRLAAGQITESTFENYVYALAHAPSEQRLDRFRPSDIEAWMTAMADEGYSPSARRRAFLTLRAAFATARRNKLTTNAPFDGLETPNGDPEAEVKHATEEDVAAILAASEEPWRTLWLLYAHTGLRRSEALALTWDDIDLDEAVLRVRAGKTARAKRTVPLTPPLLEALRVYPQDGPHPFPWHKRTVNAKFAKVTPDPVLTPHSLRHGVATRMLDNGVPAHVVAALLGHANANITMKFYAHSVSKLERDAINVLV